MASGDHEADRSNDPAGGTDPGASCSEKRRQQAEQGAESYGGDSDAGPSVAEEERERGLERDQAEG